MSMVKQSPSFWLYNEGEDKTALVGISAGVPLDSDLLLLERFRSHQFFFCNFVFFSGLERNEVKMQMMILPHECGCSCVNS